MIVAAHIFASMFTFKIFKIPVTSLIYSCLSDTVSLASAEGSGSKIEEMWIPSIPFKFGFSLLMAIVSLMIHFSNFVQNQASVLLLVLELVGLAKSWS